MNNKVNQNLLPIFLLVIVSISMPFLYSKAKTPRVNNDNNESKAEKKEVHVIDLIHYTIDMGKYYKQTTISKEGEFKDGSFKTYYVCINIEDKSYVDEHCSYQGQFALFRLEEVSENEIVPEDYEYYEQLLTRNNGKKDISLYILWNSPSLDLLELAPSLEQANSENIIGVLKQSILLKETSIPEGN